MSMCRAAPDMLAALKHVRDLYADVEIVRAAIAKAEEEEDYAMPNVELTTADLDLLIEALNHRASRHESMGRFNPRGAGPHDRVAKAMRKLESRLLVLADKVD